MGSEKSLTCIHRRVFIALTKIANLLDNTLSNQKNQPKQR
jgi:hypothetical protein